MLPSRNPLPVALYATPSTITILSDDCKEHVKTPSNLIMSRLILTFESLFQVLAADKALREHVDCRATPTPSGLSTSICGVSLELLDPQEKDTALSILEQQKLCPHGIHEIG